ncbi:hypothetical protein [Bacillus altitudinis]|uniref:hypothetical protein n=1 Tax=Bacillus altitudinis TaxID=293387 RepID=UPI00064C8032|nr:hypothetical protein [Bacillus altitudinis]KLV22714.1 hypothetical protein ABW03_08900 [Bacillus altitudinis]
MIKLQIKDSTSGKEVNFEADNYKAADCNRLIMQLAAYMHGGPLNINTSQSAGRVAPPSIVTSQIKRFQENQDVSKSKDEKKATPAPSEPKRTRPRSTALLNNERTLNASIGEHVSLMDQVKSIALVQKENPEPDRMKWKTKFQCPECGLKEDKQVYKGFRYTACDNCATKVKIMPADMKNGWDHEDEEGYLYHATSRYVQGDEKL